MTPSTDNDFDNETASRIAQLETRRKLLGFTAETMAAGLAWSHRDVRDVERGIASDPYLQMYVDWLERLERMPAESPPATLRRAAGGSRFTP